MRVFFDTNVILEFLLERENLTMLKELPIWWIEAKSSSFFRFNV